MPQLIVVVLATIGGAWMARMWRRARTELSETNRSDQQRASARRRSLFYAVNALSTLALAGFLAPVVVLSIIKDVRSAREWSVHRRLVFTCSGDGMSVTNQLDEDVRLSISGIREQSAFLALLIDDDGPPLDHGTAVQPGELTPFTLLRNETRKLVVMDPRDPFAVTEITTWPQRRFRFRLRVEDQTGDILLDRDASCATAGGE